MAHSLDLHRDLQYSAQKAYRQLAENGLPLARVHTMPVCYDVVDLMIGQLATLGHDAEHEVRPTTTGQHSYVRLPSRVTHDVIADPTWQQFLPRKHVDAPKLLIGSRGKLITQARSFGVPVRMLTLWEPVGAVLDLSDLKNRADDADAAADRAFEAGKWEAFAKR